MLDEGVSAFIVGCLLLVLDVDLRKAVIEDVPCVEVNTPGNPLLDLAIFVTFFLAFLALVLLDLTVATLHVLFGVFVLAFYLAGPIGALRLPAMDETVSTEGLALGKVLSQTDTVRAALLRQFLAFHALVDGVLSRRRGRHILIDFLVLPK